MVDPNKYDEETRRWRNKYFTLSEELEKNKKDYSSYLNILHRALVRISLAAEGQDDELDKHLSSLCNLLRQDPLNQTRIKTNLGQVETTILRLESQRKDNGLHGLEPLQTLVTQLSQLNLSKDKQQALKRYSSSLQYQGNQLSAYPLLLEKYCHLQREALFESMQTATGVQTSVSQPPGKSLLSRLLGAKPKPAVPEKSDNDITPAISPATNEVSSTIESIPEIKTCQESIEDQEAIISVLVDLLEHLPLSADARGDANQLREQLTELAGAGELNRIIDGTAELVIEALEKSQRGFERFLLTLDQQLAQINDFFSAQGRTKGTQKDASQQLNTMIHSQVDTISQTMNEATDLNSLKASVQSQLNTIASSMDHFIEAETQREQALEQQLQAMSEQLEVMQNETITIREKLRSETLRALTDALTRLPNRVAFDERIEQEHERYLRYKNPATLALLDIDLFKKVNDKHGHLVGDRVLQEVARQAKKMVRKTDFLARYGGEEFILIMPETTLESAAIVLEKIRAAIAKISLRALGPIEPVTVSVGLAAFQSGEGSEQLIERADQALYQAKDKGRNRIAIFE